MDHIKFVFVFIILYSVYEATCFSNFGRQPVPFKSGGDASLSFISGEGGQRNPIKPGQNPTENPQNVPKPGTPSRDFVNPNLKPGDPNSKPGVNPNPKPGVNPIPNPGVSSNLKPGVNPGSPNLSPTPGVQNPGVATKPAGRDFVNPNYKPGVAPVTPQNSGTTPQSIGNQNKPPGRDFVNPNYKPGSPQPKPSGQNPGMPIQNPGMSNQNPGMSIQTPPKPPGRDFVNPNYPQDPFPALKPPVRLGTTPNPPKDPFPALKPVGSVGLSNIGITPKPGQSYAQKASEVTTPKPVSPTGQPKTDSTPAPEPGPKDDELREFSEALLKKDVNNAFKYIKLNIQGKTTSQSKNDEAPTNLLEVSKDAFNIPTIAKTKLFYNNYILEVTENEHVTPQEKMEENDLIETVVATPVMQHARNLLIQHGKISKDPKEFKDLLKTIWFSMYSRGHGRVGSSGFEHVFLAELKKDKGEVSGLHNWIYFNEAEQTNLANYLGYMKKIDLGEKGAILKFHFTLNGTDKPVNSIFVGTSPEFEMALYTTCYVFRANRICPLQLNGNRFIIRTYPIKYRGKHLLGSAFPEI